MTAPVITEAYILNDYRGMYSPQRVKAKSTERRRKQERIARRKYFLNQRLICFFFLLICLVAALIEPLFLFGTIPAIAGIRTKKMILINEYYWKHGGADQWKL